MASTVEARSESCLQKIGKVVYIYRKKNKLPPHSHLHEQITELREGEFQLTFLPVREDYKAL